MASVTVTRGKVRHNHIDYTEGEVIGDLTDAQAKQLVDGGDCAHGANGKVSGGKPAPAKTSRVKDDLLKNKTDGPRKTVTEKAQARAQAKDDKQAADDAAKADETAQELPTSFTVNIGTDQEAEYASVVEGEGTDAVTKYLRGDDEITEAEYTAAYEQSVADASSEDDDQGQGGESQDGVTEFDHDGKHYRTGKAKNGVAFYQADKKPIKKVEFLQAAGAAGVTLSED